MNPYKLVKIDRMDNVIIDMRYAKKENTFGTVLYDKAEAWLLENCAKKLVIAAKKAKAAGYKLKIWDAYRPKSVQKMMWDICPRKDFVAAPEKGSNHNRGAAVDITLADSKGNDISMPSTFDEFSERATYKYSGGSQKSLDNRNTLRKIMEESGFEAYSEEWWHYTDPESRKEPLLDILISDLDKEAC